MINEHNYEEYMLLYVDGELDSAMVAQLLQFLQQHPELEAEFNSYNQLKLVPDEALIYNGKEKLLKEERKTVRLVPLWMYGAAASLVLLVVLKWMMTGTATHDGTTSSVATNNINNTSKTTTITKTTTINKPKSTTHQPQLSDDTASAQQQLLASARQAHNGLVKNRIPNTRIVSKQIVKQEESSNARAAIADIAKIDAASVTPVAVVANVPCTIAVSVPALMPDVVATKKKDDIIKLLPLDDEKKEGLYEVKNHLASGIAKLQHLPRTLKETTLSLRLGNTEIVSLNL